VKRAALVNGAAHGVGGVDGATRDVERGTTEASWPRVARVEARAKTVLQTEASRPHVVRVETRAVVSEPREGR
jgi:hypothetical protein